MFGSVGDVSCGGRICASVGSGAATPSSYSWRSMYPWTSMSLNTWLRRDRAAFGWLTGS